MGFTDLLEKWFPIKGTIGPGTITVNVPPELYYKELALYTGITLISNAVAKSEIKTFQNGKEVQTEDYYILNIAPNPNQSSSEFWHDVINKAIRQTEGAYVVEYKGYLYCVDSCPLSRQDSINGNIYSNISINEFTFPGNYKAENLYHFKWHDAGINSLMAGIGEEYGKLLKSASNAFKRSNGVKYKLKIDNVQAGDQEFQKEFTDYLQEQITTYISSENAVYPEFVGRVLEKDEQSSGTASSAEMINLRKDMFEMVSNALHIPMTLMTGNITNMNEIVKVFLTFCVDPVADMIQEVLNKRAGINNWKEKNYYKVDTGKINHRDIFDLAQAVDKLIASGNMCIDEIREEIGYEPLNTEWSRQHWMTKNYVKIEEMMQAIEEGREIKIEQSE